LRSCNRDSGITCDSVCLRVDLYRGIDVATVTGLRELVSTAVELFVCKLCSHVHGGVAAQLSSVGRDDSNSCNRAHSDEHALDGLHSHDDDNNGDDDDDDDHDGNPLPQP
jgi:hypothetical protein